jgi:hypothetical protein
MLMNDFAHPLAQLSAVTYTSADDTYTVYGWTVAMHRTAIEFSARNAGLYRGRKP